MHAEAERGESEDKNDVQRCPLFSGPDKLKVRKFIGKGTRTLSETEASQEVTRQAFLKGECNLLLVTSVAEEGTDTYTHTHKHTNAQTHKERRLWLECPLFQHYKGTLSTWRIHSISTQASAWM
jgi:hypothetical protein